MMLPPSMPGVARVELLCGDEATSETPPDLLVEVPHGASTRAHYDALRGRLTSTLPRDLHAFFHINTDTGAWDYGRRVAELVLAAEPRRTALIVRCLVPRTFVDTNRFINAETGDLTRGGITGAIPSYIDEPADHQLLRELHGQYFALAEQAYKLVAGRGGFGLIPHSYMPRSLRISRVDEHIVTNLRRAHEPDEYAQCELRAEVDLITCTAQGIDLSPEGLADHLIELCAEVGIEVVVGGSYILHPATMGLVWSQRYPGRVLCLEVRRDLLVEEWVPFEEQHIDPAKVERFAGPLAAVIADRLPPIP